MNLTESVRLHSLWLEDDRTGQRAVLTNLEGASLAGVNLVGARLIDDVLAVDRRGCGGRAVRR